MIALILSLALQTDPGAALEKFKTDYKSRDPAARAAAVAELAKTDHDKVVAKLAALLVVDETEVRLSAVAGLAAERENRDSLKKSIAALQKGFAPNAAAGQKKVLVAIVEALEKKGEGIGLAVMHQTCASPNIPVAQGAIEAAGAVGKRASVPVLIHLARVLEAQSREATNVGPGGRTVTGGGIPGVGGGAGDPDAPKRARTLVPACYQAMYVITGQSFKSVKEWADWWAEKGQIQVDK